MIKSINRIRLEFKDTGFARKFKRDIPVLIESDWNLKRIFPIVPLAGVNGINRIRLEFKAKASCKSLWQKVCINRIRLEFKGIRQIKPTQSAFSINRIRLEFKV